MTDSDLRTLASLWDTGVKQAALQVINDEALNMETTDGKYAFYKSLQKGILQQDKVKGAMAVLVSQEDRAKAIKIARDMWTQDLDDNTSIINFKNTKYMRLDAVIIFLIEWPHQVLHLRGKLSKY